MLAVTCAGHQARQPRSPRRIGASRAVPYPVLLLLVKPWARRWPPHWRISAGRRTGRAGRARRRSGVGLAVPITRKPADAGPIRIASEIERPFMQSLAIARQLSLRFMRVYQGWIECVCRPARSATRKPIGPTQRRNKQPPDEHWSIASGWKRNKPPAGRPQKEKQRRQVGNEPDAQAHQAELAAAAITVRFED